ncbi:mechanosensitive ion channel family protein [Haloterrigena salinisoli]|uniref:mechanosensitive ion channel family protein n=1 Tax=Haloterrigena salinisoli TaxID=3132747 RepID=UPI0030CE9A9B
MIQPQLAQQGQIPNWLQDPIAELVTFLPRLIGALVILFIGWIVGRIAAGAVRKIADGIELDRMVLETPLGRILGGTEQAVSSAFGSLAKWFVYSLAILAAANALAIQLLSEWIATAVSYLPAFIAGLLVIVIGFVVADFVGDIIERTRAAAETVYGNWFANGARMFLYFTAIVIGLDTMGIDVSILYVFARALAWGLAAAVAIGAGVAFGWGGKDYVSENIGSWMGRTASVKPDDEASDGGGRSTGSDRSTGSRSRRSDRDPGSEPGPTDDD